MKFRPVPSSSSSGGEAQFSIPSLPSKSSEDFTGAGRSGTTKFRQLGIVGADKVKSAATSMTLSPPPPPSSTKKKRGGGGGKRSMIRSPLSMLSPNSKGSASTSRASGSRGGDTMMGGSVGSSARKLLFSSPSIRGGGGQQSAYSPVAATTTNSSRVSLSGSKVKGSLRKDRKRHKKSSMASGTRPAAATIANTVSAQGTQVSKNSIDVDEAATGTAMADNGMAMDTNDAEAEVESSTVVELGSKRDDVPVVEFTYPTGDVAIPGPAVLEYFHGLATTATASSEGTSGTISMTPPTHQVQLDTLGTALLSLEDVLIPSAAHEENAALRRIQSKLQRDESGNAMSIGITKEVRAFVMGLAGTAALAVTANRLEREEALSIDEARQLEEARVARAEARAKRRAERERRREERRSEREFEKERARVRRKKNLPRNKELWREVAMLMTDLARLQKEEKMWDAAGKELDGKEVEFEERVVKMLEDRQLAKDQEHDQDDSMALDVIKHEQAQVDLAEMSVRNVVDDITLSAGRINATLASITDLMAQSDGVRTGLYDKYRADHQFYGYRGSRDTKGLIAALSQDG